MFIVYLLTSQTLLLGELHREGVVGIRVRNRLVGGEHDVIEHDSVVHGPDLDAHTGDGVEVGGVQVLEEVRVRNLLYKEKYLSVNKGGKIYIF